MCQEHLDIPNHLAICSPMTVDRAREDHAPAKDPATPPQHTQTYTYLHTSIHTKQSRSNTHKHIHKTEQKHIHKTKQTRPSPQHPTENRTAKKITLYNSKYCIR